MADSNTERRKHKKKRKNAISDDENQQRHSKASRVDEHAPIENDEAREQSKDVDILEFQSPWSNLQLILSLENKDIDIQRKVELAYAYVKLRVGEEESNNIDDLETVGMSRVLVFVNDWVQSLLISSEKRFRVEGSKDESGTSGSCLDHRCWKIFKFCLEKSIKLNVSLSISRDFLRVIHCIAGNAFSRLNVVSSDIKDLESDVFEFYSTVLDCMSLIFKSHGGISNENLDLWILTVELVLNLVRKVLEDKLDDCKMGGFVLHFSCAVIKPFTKFLKVHPARKNGFNCFVNKLLEPLLYMLKVLHPYTSDGWKGNLQNLIEEVLCQGLFHPIHIDGYTSLQSLTKYTSSDYQQIMGSKMEVKSYHRHFFDKLKNINTGTNSLALGELYRLYVECIKKQKGISFLGGGGSGQLEDKPNGHIVKMSSRDGNLGTENTHSANGLSSETRMTFFDFFVQMTEPFLEEIYAYLQGEPEVGDSLSTAHSSIKSINKLLATFMRENVYVRTEDTSEGACVNFLKVICETVRTLSARIKHILPLSFDIDKRMHKEIIIVIVNELIFALKCLLEIEYEVFGDDLESLWIMLISHGSSGLMLLDKPEQSLTPEIIQLGIRLISLYSELRQVNKAVISLCKAVRHLLLSVGDGQMRSSNLWRPSLYCESSAKFLGMLLCSHEFRLSIYSAIKSIPEGQVSGFIRQITADVSESFVWMKGDCSTDGKSEPRDLESDSCISPCFMLKAEVFGRSLSELYTLILDSVTTTTGNSTLVGVAVNDLIAVIRPNMRCLVGLQPESISVFLSTLTGGTITMTDECKHVRLSTHWVVLFFFRLYMSSKSLYRQTGSLVPPDISRKMSESMGDLLTAYSGQDWLTGTIGTDEGYFSWIVQPSNSLLSTIEAVLCNCIQDSVADCSSLVYVLITMSLQRLVDLNRLIKSFEYMIEHAGMSAQNKKKKKWGRLVSDLTHEAAELTNYVMKYIAVFNENQLPFSSAHDVTDCQMHVKSLPDYNGWNFSVGALDKKSLPTAVWWIFCQNIDVWCAHPAKKKLKNFLSLLIQCSLPTPENHSSVSAKHVTDRHGNMKLITPHQISFELLSNAALYEQRFVCRHMASRFCKIMEKSVLQIFRNVRDIHLNAPLDWSEISFSFESSSGLVTDCKILRNHLIMAEPISYLSNKLYFRVKIEECQSLLKFLCWMPKGNIDARSLSDYTRCIINLERLLLGSLLHHPEALQPHGCLDLFRLFFLCRKALYKLTMASKEKIEQSHSISNPIHHESVFPTSWLLMSLSAVFGLQHMFPDNCTPQSKALIFSLMDHTSYIFLIFSRDQFMHAINCLLNSVKPCEEIPDLCLDSNSNLDEDETSTRSVKDLDVWNTIVSLVESLKEQANISHISLKKVFSSIDVKDSALVLPEVEKLSPAISCIQGILCGIASALDKIDGERCDLKSKLSKLKCEPLVRINICIDVFADFISYVAKVMFLEDGKLPQSLCDTQDLPISKAHDHLLCLKETSSKGCSDDADYHEEQPNFGNTKDCSSSKVSDKFNKRVRVRRKHEDLASSLTKINLFELQYLDKSLLLGFLRGENLKAAFLLRQLFIAYSSILRINMHIKKMIFSASLVPTFVAIAEVLLLEFAEMVESPHTFCFVWLDGIAIFLEELGRQFHLASATSTQQVYVKLINLHLRALGKCIALQGKGATLASHETESSTKTLDDQTTLCESSYGQHSLNELKARLRMSFRVLLEKTSELHLSSAIQAIEIALVGSQEGYLSNYAVCTGYLDGGTVSSTVAAGVDCLDLVLEYVKGNKRLPVVKRHIQTIVSSLFNILLHLQGPKLFVANTISYSGDATPDSGSVVLMIIEVLTRVFGKHTLFQVDGCYVSQSLRVSGGLFQNIIQLKNSKVDAQSNPLLVPDTVGSAVFKSMNTCNVDRQYMVELYGACCRLLCTVLKHYKSESQRCIALLQGAVYVLLCCLEMVDVNPANTKDYFTWKVQEGIKCAYFLRRIYEEIRQQKDVLSHCSFHFLSSYIWIYSGYGPRKMGIRRDIDEALRPGIYALIDSCTADDLQHMHSVFGEGPCRSTLANLQHDYKLMFQYEGKV